MIKIDIDYHENMVKSGCKFFDFKLFLKDIIHSYDFKEDSLYHNQELSDKEIEIIRLFSKYANNTIRSIILDMTIYVSHNAYRNGVVEEISDKLVSVDFKDRYTWLLENDYHVEMVNRFLHNKKYEFYTLGGIIGISQYHVNMEHVHKTIDKLQAIYLAFHNKCKIDKDNLMPTIQENLHKKKYGYYKVDYDYYNIFVDKRP